MKQQHKHYTLLWLTLLSICLIFGAGCNSSSKNKATIEYNGKTYRHKDTIKITGYITTVGSEPLTETVIVAMNNEQFVIPPEHKAALKEAGFGMVSIEGILEIKILRTVKDNKEIYIPQLIPIKVEKVN